MTDDAEAFWAFSLRVYAGEGVQPACLALQDVHGLDVNVALWCAFAASRGLDPRAALDEARALSEAWSGDVVQPLRAARRALKTERFEPMGIGAEDRLSLRRAVQAAELNAERLEQFALGGLIARCPRDDRPAAERAQAALEAYAASASAREDIAIFVQNVFRAAEIE
jgi:uncharacterized protein (TIGR02444 family)